jgi:hypothetical protein
VARLRESTPEAEGKPSLNRATESHALHPKPKRATHGQAEGVVTHTGGPNQLELQVYWMTCG